MPPDSGGKKGSGRPGDGRLDALDDELKALESEVDQDGDSAAASQPAGAKPIPPDGEWNQATVQMSPSDVRTLLAKERSVEGDDPGWRGTTAPRRGSPPPPPRGRADSVSSGLDNLFNDQVESGEGSRPLDAEGLDRERTVPLAPKQRPAPAAPDFRDEPEAAPERESEPEQRDEVAEAIAEAEAEAEAQGAEPPPRSRLLLALGVALLAAGLGFALRTILSGGRFGAHPTIKEVTVVPPSEPAPDPAAAPAPPAAVAETPAPAAMSPAAGGPASAPVGSPVNNESPAVAAQPDGDDEAESKSPRKRVKRKAPLAQHRKEKEREKEKDSGRIDNLFDTFAK